MITAQPQILLISRVDVELVDYGEDPTARARIRSGGKSYLYEVDRDGGRWYREGRSDVPITSGDVSIVCGPMLVAAARGAAHALLATVCPGVQP